MIKINLGTPISTNKQNKLGEEMGGAKSKLTSSDSTKYTNTLFSKFSSFVSRFESSKVLVLFLTLSLFAQISVAANPACIAKGRELSVNNDAVLNWKSTTKNQYHDRGHIQGILTRFYSDKTGHNHFQVQIGQTYTDTIEVVYNQEFGPVPSSMQIGSHVEACGDYITANVRQGGYPPSPDGAIVHWVHKSTNPNHESGYLVIDGTLCGWN